MYFQRSDITNRHVLALFIILYYPLAAKWPCKTGAAVLKLTIRWGCFINRKQNRVAEVRKLCLCLLLSQQRKATATPRAAFFVVVLTRT